MRLLRSATGRHEPLRDPSPRRQVQLSRVIQGDPDVIGIVMEGEVDRGEEIPILVGMMELWLEAIGVRHRRCSVGRHHLDLGPGLNESLAGPQRLLGPVAGRMAGALMQVDLSCARHEKSNTRHSFLPDAGWLECLERCLEVAVVTSQNPAAQCHIPVRRLRPQPMSSDAETSVSPREPGAVIGRARAS